MGFKMSNQMLVLACATRAYCHAMVVIGATIVTLPAVARAYDPPFLVSPDATLTEEQAARALKESNDRLRLAKEERQELLNKFGETHPAFERGRPAMEQLYKVHAVEQGLLPLLVGPRNDEKQAEITRLAQELNALTEELNHRRAKANHDAAVETSKNAQLESSDAASERLAVMRLELEKVQKQLSERERRLMESAQQIAEGERTRSLPPLENGDFKIYRLQNMPAQNAAQAIEALFGARSIRVAVDERTNTLILLGERDHMAVVDALLVRLDQENSDRSPLVRNASEQNRSLLLRVFWLADGLPEGEGRDPAEVLPASVLRAAKKLGLAKPALVTHTVNSLRVSGGPNGTQFSADVPAVLNERGVQLQYSGKISLDNANQPMISMQVNVNEPNCNLQGSLSLPVGHFMVLGTANSVMAQMRPAPVSRSYLELKAVGEPGDDTSMTEGGTGAGQQVSFDTLRFAFVVQIVEGESFPPEK